MANLTCSFQTPAVERSTTLTSGLVYHQWSCFLRIQRVNTLRWELLLTSVLVICFMSLIKLFRLKTHMNLWESLFHKYSWNINGGVSSSCFAFYICVNFDKFKYILHNSCCFPDIIWIDCNIWYYLSKPLYLNHVNNHVLMSLKTWDTHITHWICLFYSYSHRP